MNLNQAAEENNRLRSEVDRLRTELTTAWEDRDDWKGSHLKVEARLREAKARLAAVIAAVGTQDCPYGYDEEETGCLCTMCKVRAAATGDTK